MEIEEKMSENERKKDINPNDMKSENSNERSKKSTAQTTLSTANTRRRTDE